MSLDSELVKQISNLQKQVDGLVKPEVGRWVDWTPTIDQGGAVARTVSYAKYIILANAVIIRCRLAITGAGVGNNAIIISGIPTLAQPSDVGGTSVIGICMILDNGTAYYSGPLLAIGANDFRVIQDGSGNYIGISPNFALANTDSISFVATYEKA